MGHGRTRTWTLRAIEAPTTIKEIWPGSALIIAVRSVGTREGRPIEETRYYVTSLRTTAKALLQHVRDRWSIENSWHWVRDTQLREDAHRYRERNGVQVLAGLRTVALNLRWVPFIGQFWPLTSITPGGRNRVLFQSRPHRECRASTGSAQSLTRWVPSATTWRSCCG
ncbi:ISAs1 family transposase [Vulcanococcus limneticus]|uniref:ISAs1 family transposase n=1 Tax=Vulcanococcus limneticus TaxID=2170428 RepID=UPI00398BC7B5